MGVVFHDTFNHGSDGDELDGTSPDTTGTSWSEVEITGTATLTWRIRTGDHVWSDNQGASHVYLEALPAPTEADVDVEANLEDSSPDNNPLFIVARAADANNLYCLRIEDSTEPADMFLEKYVSGSLTNLDTALAAISSGDDYKLEIRGDDLKVYVVSGSGYVEVMSRSVFSAGISYRVVESKWPEIREAMWGFNTKRIADSTPEDIDQLAQDRRVVRNRRKLEAIAANARRMIELEERHGSLRNYLRSFGDLKPPSKIFASSSSS